MEEKPKSYYTFDRKDLVILVPWSAKKILDVGCGEGIFGKRLKELNNGVEVVGIEKNDTAYRMAIKNLDSVILGDIEAIELPYGQNYFDCIVANDVLEHLTDPWTALKKLHFILKENGTFISSMPNIGYYKVIRGLLFGRWDYADFGILDKTHLRFFCLKNIKEMFQTSGFKIDKVRRNIVSARILRILNILVLNSLRDFLTYQYYIVARKAHDAECISPL